MLTRRPITYEKQNLEHHRTRRTQKLLHRKSGSHNCLRMTCQNMCGLYELLELSERIRKLEEFAWVGVGYKERE